jgi:hypothetical protein
MGSFKNATGLAVGVALGSLIATALAEDRDASSAALNSVKAASVWLAPRNQPPIPAPDFMDLFQPDAPWPKAASHVQIFELYPQFINSASDTDLQTVIVGLQHRHIGLAIEYGMVDYTDKTLCDGTNPHCGHIESSGGQVLARALARIKRLGGDLRYITMDEPLWFGHISRTQGASHASVAALAKNVAKQVATAHQYFPNVQVGEAEPVVSGRASPSNYVDEIIQWARAYKEATGKPLAFFHADVAWQPNGGTPDQLAELSKVMRKNGIKFGIIYNGNATDQTGVEWTTNAERHFVAVETDPLMIPDDAIIQSWVTQPLYALPETQPGTMTYLVNRYLAAETEIQAVRTRTGFEGRLVSHGIPVADAQISAYAVDDGALNIKTTSLLTDTVPPGSVAARVGLRINVECNCNGPVDILLGPAQFVDKKTGALAVRDIVTPMQRVVLTAQQTMLKNSPSFSVTAGNAFSFSISMLTSYDSRNSGYVAIIFLDAAGKEITRMELPLRVGQRPIFMGRTDRNGGFTVDVPEAPISSSLVSFDFSGSDNFRLKSVTLKNGNQPALPH